MKNHHNKNLYQLYNILEIWELNYAKRNWR